MALTLKTLISQLSNAKPQAPVFTEPSRAAGTPEEVAVAFDELDHAFAFNRSSNSLIVNEVITLNETERNFLTASISSFNEKMRTQQLVIDKGVNGLLAPVTAERTNSNQGIRGEEPGTASAIALPASAACAWQWSFGTYWWGFKVSFNSCAISWLSAGGKAVDQALTAFKLPAIATPIVKLAATLLKPFDKGNGSVIYFTWVGAFWITGK